jgi:hypothetical protein
MAKTPTAAPKKTTANAPRATAAPAKKVETPAEAQEPKTAANTGTAPTPIPAAGQAGGTGLEPDTTSQGQADVEGKDTSTATSTDAATAAQGVAAIGAIPGPAETDPGKESAPAIDVEAIRKEGYQAGYSDGFSAALDELNDGSATATDTGTDDGTDQLGEQDPAYGTGSTDYAQRDLSSLIALALFTPDNQRKGGLAPVVKRLSDFLDGLDPDDRYPALQMMHAIAQNKPVDLATGRFALVVREGLAILNGNGTDPLANETAADRGEAAAARFEQAFQQEDETETAGPDDGLPDGVDVEDPDSGAAAAARLAGA